MMRVFYNKEGVGDTLMISVAELAPEDRAFVKKGDAVRIYSSASGETAGFNLFNASSYLEIVSSGGVVELTENLLSKLNECLNQNGFEDQLHADLSPKFVVGFVETKEKHPNADKLSVCQVNTGSEKLQIVCGAPNVDSGQKVVVAKVGAVMPSGLVIKDAELRGVASSGMICSAKELNLPDAPQEKGILVLDDHYEIGTDFFKK
jgi:tRNA-binding protein